VAKAAGFLSDLLDRIVGERLISVRMVNISLAASLITYGSVLILTMIFGMRYQNMRVALTLAIGAIFFPVLSFLFALRWPRTRLPDLVLIGPTLIWLSWPIGSEPIWSALHLIAGSIGGIGSDVFFVAVVRWALRKLAKKATLRLVLFVIALQIIIWTILLVLPTYIAIKLGWPRYFHKSGDPPWMIPELIVLFNLPTAFISSIFAAMLGLLQVHRLIWPALSRFFYPLARFEIVRKRKVMVGIGIACFCVISPPFAELLKKVSEWFK